MGFNWLYVHSKSLLAVNTSRIAFHRIEPFHRLHINEAEINYKIYFDIFIHLKIDAKRRSKQKYAM